MKRILLPVPSVKPGKSLTVVSMVTEFVGRKYRSVVLFSDGETRTTYGDNAKSAEQNALHDLNLDWSHFLPI
jgi:hypothetical protein